MPKDPKGSRAQSDTTLKGVPTPMSPLGSPQSPMSPVGRRKMNRRLMGKTRPAGGGGAVSRGGAPPWAAGRSTFDSRVDPNPYLDQIFDRYGSLFERAEELYGKAPDPTAALEDYKDLRAQGMREATAQAGRRGFAPGTGMSLAQTQDLLQRSQQGEQELTADWANRALMFQKDLLGSMGNVLSGAAGVGAGIGQEQLGWGAQGLEGQRLASDAWYKANMLPIEMERARTANLASQISAISALAGLAREGLY